MPECPQGIGSTGKRNYMKVVLFGVGDVGCNKRNRKRNAGTHRHSAPLEVRWYIIRDAHSRLISMVIHN